MELVSIALCRVRRWVDASRSLPLPGNHSLSARPIRKLYDNSPNVTNVFESEESIEEMDTSFRNELQRISRTQQNRTFVSTHSVLHCMAKIRLGSVIEFFDRGH